MTTRARHVEIDFTIEDTDLGQFEIVTATITERLSQPTVMTVRVATPSALATDDLLGKPATLAVIYAEGEQRPWHGLIMEASLSVTRPKEYALSLVIASRLEMLRLGRNRRMFQEMSVQDVVTQLLDESGTGVVADWAQRATLDPRPYIVQQGESDYDFCARLLAEEGLTFAVEQAPTEERIGFFDEADARPPIDGDPEIADAQQSGLAADILVRARERVQIAPDKVMMRDYDIARPAEDLSATEESDDSAGREVYHHPGGYLEKSVGGDRAAATLDGARARARTLSAHSDCPRLEAGRLFSFAGHRRDAMNEELLLVEVVHRLTRSSSAEEKAEAPEADVGALAYGNQLTAVSSSVRFRPVPLPKPPVAAQNAIVTGAGGEEIHTDEYARVKVRFPWDRSGVTDDKSSTWLRVGQMPLSGSMIVPRVGFEVLVGFELGDVDRPYTMGHLYNGEAPPPYALPDHAPRSSIQSATTDGGPGANELRFDDSAGSEEIFINASKDYTVVVDDCADWNVQVDEAYNVGGKRSVSVGADHTENVSGNDKLTVGTNQELSIGEKLQRRINGNEQVHVGGARMVTVGGDHSEEAHGDLTRTVGGMQTITGLQSYSRKVVGSATAEVGAAWAEVVAGGRMVSVGKVHTESVGALKMIKAADLAISCGAAYTVTAAAETVKCGGNRVDQGDKAVAINAAGGTKIEAKTITFEAEDKLVLKGGKCSIELTKMGDVTIKAPEIEVKNAKVLNQLIHKSG